MGVNKRSTIKVDIPQEIQTGSPQRVNANDSFELKQYFVVDFDGVPIGGTKNIYIFAPAGKNCRVRSLGLDKAAVLASTLGTHVFSVTVGSTFPIIYGRSTFNSKLEFSYSHWYIANSLQLPPSDTAQAIAIEHIDFSDTISVRIQYINFTDVVATLERVIELIVEESEQ